MQCTIFHILDFYRFAQIGVVSYGRECPSHGVYARTTEVKHWIQYITGAALDTNCNFEIPQQPGEKAEGKSDLIFYSVHDFQHS